MIPKIVHYCWFGGNEMSPLIQECIKSWHRYLPDWEFILWNEENSPLEHAFVKKALKDKKYAFVADYVRCYALYEYGGVYLDTDMEIIKDITLLLSYSFFSAYEDSDYSKVSCGAIGCEKEHLIVKKILEYYDNQPNLYIAMPQILGKVYTSLSCADCIILPSTSFYPYNPFDEEKPVKQLMYVHIKEDTYGIHHWGYSWKFNYFERIMNKLKRIIRGL
ncbi:MULTISPECIES: glycosyltransferase [unclassified Acinetobacter]|uniref:glycosyltransferase family 32 protein n=1 Tax=unclassified Acinetobacter TaxID=196816 RepID=UPI00244CDABC|nr:MULTISPECIES: glycosyltransferase [unclassified Acinetobacter]MDH0032427.1 glycosyltransferase [Acinetobacter sp. GD04021]MDH0888042.1 glycosyltransferase [Acinetobacter sp. GD03873]MDH1084302.1 glycosyltransferase [Acinetobacter sp. GD03983]MDH2191334.1 glycosyltransferase [Acinetobacter sp. GD03645]MDH2204872.1 glycosyltransferase [Acinetobacter sp. GD03647]